MILLKNKKKKINEVKAAALNSIRKPFKNWHCKKLA